MRQNEAFRRMIRETHLTVDDLILPLFAIGGRKVQNPIASMPGHFQLSVDNLVKAAREVHALGIPAVILFGSGPQGPAGNLRLRRRRHRPARHPGAEGRPAGSGRDHRRMPVPVHRPRPLRVRGRRPHRQRCFPGPHRPHRSLPRQGRGRHGGALGHDGRPGGGDPRSPGRKQLQPRSDHGLFGQVLLGLLRPFPCRG